jgi:hypothetical protein
VGREVEAAGEELGVGLESEVRDRRGETDSQAAGFGGGDGEGPVGDFHHGGGDDEGGGRPGVVFC